MTQRRRHAQPLDRVAPAVMALLAVVIIAMLLFGSQALPRVRNFSWQHERVKAKDVAFMLTFTQPMVPESVEQQLVVDPPLSGKISWAGRRMAYTLEAPAPYGESFKIALPEATALSGQKGFEPFDSKFQTRDRVFAYIGAEGEETGRLIMFNLTQKKKTILTAVDQTVLDFEPYPQRDRILFSAVSASESADRVASAQIYSVTTGLSNASTYPSWQFWRQNTPAEAGTTELVLDNRRFQNLKFDLAPNGETLVVQRVEQNDPSNYGPWLVQPGQAPRKIKTEPGGDFQIAPDSSSLLLQQGKGTAVIDLQPETEGAEAENLLLDFLPEYGLTLDIADDGTSAALVNFNQDDPEARFTQSLFWVSNRGDEKLLLQTDGAILSAQFNENNKILYCLVNRLLKNGLDEPESEANADSAKSENSDPSRETANDTSEDRISEDSIPEDGALAPGEPIDLSKEAYSFSPYLTAINVETGEEYKLLEMPPQPEITVSLSPDGLAILFDEVLVNEPQRVSDSESSPEYDGPTHRLWLLPLFSTLEERLAREPIALPPSELEIAGRHPAWLP